MLRSRNTQLVGEQDLERGKRVSIENLKRLVSENFPEADLKVRMSCKTNYVYYIVVFLHVYDYANIVIVVIQPLHRRST